MMMMMWLTWFLRSTLLLSSCSPASRPVHTSDWFFYGLLGPTYSDSFRHQLPRPCCVGRAMFWSHVCTTQVDRHSTSKLTSTIQKGIYIYSSSGPKLLFTLCFIFVQIMFVVHLNRVYWKQESLKTSPKYLPKLNQLNFGNSISKSPPNKLPILRHPMHSTLFALFVPYFIIKCIFNIT